jgi:hypothetical protein
VVFCSHVPPVSVFQLKHCEWETGEVRGDIADLLAS